MPIFSERMQKMKKKEEFLYLGLHFSLSTAADNCGAPRRRLYLYAPDVKRSLDQKCFRSTDNEAPKKIEDGAKELLLAHRTEILGWLRDSRLPKAPLSLYAFLEHGRLLHALGSGRAAVRRLQLLGDFLNVSKITPIFDVKSINSLIPNIFTSNQARLDIYFSLDILYQLLLEDGICIKNPFQEKALRFSRSQAEKASQNLTQKHANVSDLRAFLYNFIENPHSNPIYGAALLHMLTGLRVYELCGLSIESFQAQNGVFSLKIDHIFYQKRGERPTFSVLLDSAHAYRYIPLTPLCTAILRSLCEKRLTEVASLSSPLFVDQSGKRLVPEDYKKFIKPYISELFNVKNADFRTDFMRENFSFYARRICGFIDAQVDVLLGRAPQRTFELCYPGYAHAALCAHLAAQLDRWHRLLLTPEGLRGIPTLMLSASVKKGATLHIRTPHGAESTIEYMPSS